MAFGIEELTHGNDFILGIIGGVAIAAEVQIFQVYQKHHRLTASDQTATC
jgi:hypothetical protein